MIRQKFLNILISLALLMPLALSKVYAIPDGAGNEVFPSVNVGIGTKTPQTALAITNGNLGIGTWTATQALDVKGNITATGTITGTTISGTINPSALEVTGQTTLNTSSGNTGIGTTLTGGNTAKLAVIGGNVGIGTITPQASLVVTNGNVGVGTWTAAQALDVKGTVKMTGFVLTSSPSNGYVLTSDASGNGSWTAPSAGSSQWFTASGLGIGTYDKVGLGTNLTGQTAKLAIVGGNVGIGTVDAQGAFVVTNGNIGIGTWVPITLLHLESALDPNSSLASRANYNLFIRNTTGTSGVGTGIAFQNNSASADNIGAAIVFRRTNTSSQGELQFYTKQNTTGSSPPSQVMVLTDAGNVGIGTVTASAQLSIAGNGVGIGTNGNTRFLTTAPPSGGMIVEGNVGLGTATPQAKFTVLGGNVGIGTWTAAGGNLIINGGGNVGIGTAWPGVALDINGSIRASNSGDSYFQGNVGFGTALPNSSIDIHGSLGVITVSKSSNYTATASDYVILVDSSGGAVTITLPAVASSYGRSYVIKKTDSSGNAVTIDGNAAETIDGQATVSITAQYGAYTIVCDGSVWWIL